MRFSILAALLVAGIALSGCATSSILVGTQRPETSPDQVKLYLSPPAKYEEIALLESSNMGRPTFTQQQATNVVIERMKREAAKLGANGILLRGVETRVAGAVVSSTSSVQATGPSTGTVTSTGIATPMMGRFGSGVAIFVEEE